MLVYFWTFNKRRNSTKQPTTTGTAINCTLKDDCSILNPVLIISGNHFGYDYARITDFNRRYFVTDCISLANGRTEIHLTVDLLGTYKAIVGATKAMIAYASDHYNLLMADSRIPALQTRTAAGVGDLDNPIFSLQSASYLLTVYNTINSDASGFSVTYLLNEKALTFVRDWLAQSGVIAAISNYFHGNPMDGIISCKWIPYKVNSADVTSQSMIWIGDQYSGTLPSGATAYIVKNFPYDSYTINLTRPYIYNDYRAWEPYTTGYIYLPGVGNLDLSLGEWRTSKINVSVNIEVITGNVTYLLFRDDGALIQSATCNVASDIPLGKVMQSNNVLTSIGSTAAGVAAFATAAATGGASVAIAGGAAAAVTGALNTALNANRHGQSITGSIGGRGTLLWPYITMTEVAVDTEDPTDADWIAEKGRPVGYVESISAFSGYVQCIDAHVSSIGMDSERQGLEEFLNSGIYYE